MLSDTGALRRRKPGYDRASWKRTEMAKTLCLETSDRSSTALSLDSLRLSSYLCDVVIISEDGQRFPAHRIILAASSRFFRTMFEGSFLESRHADVAIGNVDGAVMKILIEYVYRGKTECPASVDSVLSIYEAAHSVQFDELFRICSDWLKLHVTESNCVTMGIVADRYGDTGLVRACDRFAAVNIALLAEGGEFLSLSVEHLSRILAQDELGVKSEDGVLIILQKWIKHDEASRRDQIETLSKFVRFSLIDHQESNDLLSDLDLVSHYHSSNGSSQRRVGCDGVLLIAGGVQHRNPVTPDIDMEAYAMSGEARLYDASKDTWTEFPSLAEKTCFHRIVTSYGDLYALGGDTCMYEYDNGKTYDPTGIVQRYDAERRQWVDDVAPMSRRRNGWEIVLCDNHIYGMSIDRYEEPMCEVLDLETKTWIPVSSPLQSFDARYHLFSLAKKVFAIGYYKGELGYMKYDPLGDRWYEFKSCPLPSGITALDFSLDPMFRSCVTTEDRLYAMNCPLGLGVVFHSCNERLSLGKDFFPREECKGLAYALDSKTMYFVGKQQIAVYEERANKWDLRSFENVVNSLEKFECAVVDRKLMLNL